MRLSKKALLSLLLALSLLTVSTALAQETAPCEGESVSGTVIAVDEETNTATIDTGEGLCTVALTTDYDHPIVDLLGSYFGDVSPENLAAALEATQACALFNEESGNYDLVECGTEGAVDVTVTSDNEDGTFSATTADGEEVSVNVDEETAEEFNGALADLSVEFDLTEEGSVSDAGDEIAAYHDDGMGFGVLVKFYAIAEESLEACEADAEVSGDEPCGVTVEELVAAFEGGMGMGQIFKEYGRPSMMGVGHVRQASECETEDGEEGEDTETAEKGKSENGKGKSEENKGKGKSGENNGKGNSEGKGKSNGKGNTSGDDTVDTTDGSDAVDADDADDADDTDADDTDDEDGDDSEDGDDTDDEDGDDVDDSDEDGEDDGKGNSNKC
ncbi:MAG: hypothetical protein OEZ02_09280 [Anaerolineae bacterium]|nr:hypothetical protein [Anaerolineae bacterium]